MIDRNTDKLIRDINKMLYELKTTDHLMGIILDIKLGIIPDNEDWQEFLHYYGEATSKIADLKYIGKTDYAEPDTSEVDVDVEKTDFMFFIRKYGVMNDQIKELYIISLGLIRDLEEDDPITVWREKVKQIKDEMGDLYEYIDSHRYLKS